MADRIERVVIVSDDCVQSGGAAAIAIASALALRGRGIAVTFLTGDDGDNPQLTAAGIDVVAIGGRHLLDGARGVAAIRGLYSGRARDVIRRWIAEHDTPQTVYHLHNWHKILSPSVFAALRPVAPRLVMTAHDYFLVCPNGGFTHFGRGEPCALTPMSPSCLVSACDKRHYAHKLWRVARQAVRASLVDLAHTDAIVLAVHEGMVPLLERGGIAPGSIEVVRNPVTPWCDTRVEAEHNSTVFFVGRLELDKGVDVLAQATREIGAALTVIGDGPLRTELQERFAHIRFLGRLDRPAISEAVRQARVVVMPTRTRETFGLVAAEALMSGIPVIASELAPITADIVANGYGLSCPPGDAGTLGRLISRLACDDATIGSMSVRAFAGARALAPHTAQWCEALIDLYERRLAPRTAPVGAPRGKAATSSIPAPRQLDQARR